jgi:hypothetical protein
MHMRFALRKEAWDVLRANRNAEQMEKEKIRTHTGFSLLDRCKICREERKEVEKLVRAKITEVETLRQKERQRETNLPGNPLAGSEGKKQP